MSNISALLNPEPAPQKPSPSSHPPSRVASMDSYTPTTTTFEAADALTALATGANNPLYAGAQDSHPPVPYPDARRRSSISSLIAPVEPSPPIEHAQVYSPTLDQYHHSSRSPDEQRWPSITSRTSSTNVLAPIHSLSSILNEQVKAEPEQASPSFGHDVSQIVPPRSSEASEERVVDGTQYREPGFVRDNPTTAQIREPSFGIQDSPHPISTAVPLTSDLHDTQPSPLPAIKPEPNGTPREGTPHSLVLERRGSVTDASVDTETLKAIEAVKQSELGLRAKSRDTVTPTRDTLKPVAAPSKKRPAPKSATTKKGMASKKPAPKKRKLDAETSSAGGTPSVRRSETPSSRTSKAAPLSKSQARITSQAGTPVGSSPAPDRSSQAPVSEVEDSEGTNEDDDAIFCICRKPDNHRWMIACDGGCEDWFHGSCVNMRQDDENLIDKYICPNCETTGKYTTWKPMCRRDGCRQPARLTKGAVSKYCSDECGVLFFKNAVGRQSKRKSETGTTGRRTKRKTHKDADGEAHMDDDEEEPSPRGGVLRTRDLKALAQSSEDIESFRKLGSGVLSPPATASPTKASFSDSPKLLNGVNHADTNRTMSAPSILLNRAETEHLSALSVEKIGLQSRLSLLKDREKFVSLTREHAVRYAEREGLKPKEVCGYDRRLAWSETEFAGWRASKIGKASLKHNTLEPADDDVAAESGAEEESVAEKEAGDDVDNSALCTKKRCARHANWQKINLQDARLEEVEVFESIKRVEQEEKEVRERAMLRARADAAAKKIDAVHGRRAEGWVERVGA
ncbi:uncharacterized protein BDZ99DRAFT_6298 [Mytilinidion resinicola]|uniref:PHD-type domain-containing protein n=1 Tax=Mytilinidion resinicola TaxID=574789 RepID=A0A6A6Z7A0_9PEZI|nr:uncharacterized protein BDZ99DRAFT_6298 [Mytilinidion resinicola]KAF2816981.1 hypothetical protein BDZ99DRAFT_6298 [Mytilinidion resinicola]